MQKGATTKKTEKATTAPKEEKRAKSSNKDEKAKPEKVVAKKTTTEKEDGPKIKKPLSGYMLFCKENRAQVVKDNEQAAPKEIMSVSLIFLIV
jgi:hypothetical protein